MRQMKTIAIINQKGGVGKSTTALSIGAGLQARGKDVLFVDLDAQGNLSYELRANGTGYGAAGILTRPETITQEIQERGMFDLVASAPALVNADKLLDCTGREYRLREALTPIKDKYDYCIIDTPPALSVLTINALTACDGLIIPAQADSFSLMGIIQLRDTLESVKRYCNPDLKVLGILITRYNGRTVIRREIAEQLEETAASMNTRVYATRIRECTAIIEAAVMRQTIFEYAPNSNAARDYDMLVDEIREDI